MHCLSFFNPDSLNTVAMLRQLYLSNTLIKVNIDSYSLSECVRPRSSSSVSLLMVMTLTAGLGEPAMKIAWRCLVERDESGSSLTDASQQLLSCPSEL